MGVRPSRYDKNAMPVAYYASTQPPPVQEILKMDTAQERIALQLYLSHTQRKITDIQVTCVCAAMPIRSWMRSVSLGLR